ncbi:MAG: glycoside hydrolase family 3 C-terminal domain-containing protein [Bacteroidetes bacterium]|nr:glycoside hydrolase family 3 C-terminal domain-containing protein [Bacteroidota bacterium]
MRSAYTALVLFLALNTLYSQQNIQYPFQDYTLPIETRVNDLIARLTLEEKVSQMVHAARSIERLGIPEYNWWNEGLHGVAFSGIATVFPQAIGLAATWDDSLMFRVASVIGTEFRAKFNDYQSRGERGIFQGLTVWSPNINIFRDPRWGRGQETYGEDPYLTSRMAVAFIKGMQGTHPKYFRVICTPKHYIVHSGPEADRHYFNAITTYRDFIETYSPAFKACIVEGGAYSVMCAYQRYLDIPCCASHFLLTHLLREKWKFQGYVVSDCGAINDIYMHHQYVKTPVEAAAVAVKAGCDLECGDVYYSLLNAVQQGLISEKDIDTALKRLFTARMKLGMFDPPELVPYSKISVSEINKPEHRALALEAARKSIVLLKNRKNILPFSTNIKTIGVIGPNADVVEVLYGNYHGIAAYPITPLQGIKNRAPKGVKILFEQGSNILDDTVIFSPLSKEWVTTIDGQSKGFTAEYYSNVTLDGKPFLIRTDTTIFFDFLSSPPVPHLSTHFSVRWSGWLTPPNTGTYHFQFMGDDGFRVFIDDSLIIEKWKDQATTIERATYNFTRGRKYKVRVEYYQQRGAAIAKLQWGRVGDDQLPKIAQLIQQSDVIVYVGGIAPWYEGEEMPVIAEGFFKGDRTTLDLPKVQEKILRYIHTFKKPIVLVLMNGGALSINWAHDNVDAILEAWYPGEQGGNAIADVLFGKYNPAGRLPVTFYSSVNDLPPFEEYAMKGRTYKYFAGNPLYEFGYGLSYTTFKYSNLKIPSTLRTNDTATISVEVENTGAMDGEEVVQLYIQHQTVKYHVPRYTLQGFKRLWLRRGEKKKIEFTITPETISLVREDGARIVDHGKVRFYVGGMQPSSNALAHSSVMMKEIEVQGPLVIIE